MSDCRRLFTNSEYFTMIPRFFVKSVPNCFILFLCCHPLNVLWYAIGPNSSLQVVTHWDRERASACSALHPVGPAWTRLFLQVQVDNQKEAEQVQQQLDIAADHYQHSDLSVDVWDRTEPWRKTYVKSTKTLLFSPWKNLSKIRSVDDQNEGVPYFCVVDTKI